MKLNVLTLLSTITLLSSCVSSSFSSASDTKIPLHYMHESLTGGYWEQDGRVGLIRVNLFYRGEDAVVIEWNSVPAVIDQSLQMSPARTIDSYALKRSNKSYNGIKFKKSKSGNDIIEIGYLDMNTSRSGKVKFELTAVGEVKVQ